MMTTRGLVTKRHSKALSTRDFDFIPPCIYSHDEQINRIGHSSSSTPSSVVPGIDPFAKLFQQSLGCLIVQTTYFPPLPASTPQLRSRSTFYVHHTCVSKRQK